jgi:hypothetical protein
MAGGVGPYAVTGLPMAMPDQSGGLE